MEKLVLIGASTGGPGHLKKILSSLRNNIDYAIVIAQHMNPSVTYSFAEYLNEISQLPVILADKEIEIKKGNVYICATSMELKSKNNRIYLKKSKQKSIYSPNIDILFLSAINLLSNIEVNAILLTGIGKDGAKGIDALEKNGANCIVESEETAIIYGMPKQAYLLNNKLKKFSLYEIIRALKNA